MVRRSPRQFKKAGLSGLLCYAAFALALLFMIAAAANAEPLAIEVVAAEAAYDQWTSEPVISFRMSPASQKAFGLFTQANVGRKFALRVHGQTVSEPVIRDLILGGAGQISSHFTVQQARDIAARLSSGKSKLEVEIVN
jgi:preprotein translocase subunit SecD